MLLEKIGRYNIVKPIGKWAMGVVYEAHDPNIRRHVAIKTIRVDHLSEALAAKHEARFRAESRTGGRLAHPNIIGVYDIGRDQGLAFMVMELVRGGDLRQYLNPGKSHSFDQCMTVMRDLLSALNFAHEQGVVHRDVRPANLMFDWNRRVKLGDFGVAQMADARAATRSRGSKAGTLNYLSPEQVSGAAVDARADLFAAGAVLYQMATGTQAFSGARDLDVFQAIAQHQPPPSSFDAGLPAGLDAVITKALAKRPEPRFASAKDFALALKALSRVVATARPSAPVPSSSGAQGDGGGLAHGSGLDSLPASAVSQEMDLLYWKDIQDSAEPDDFQGFLRQFPVGVYAGLARRRLRKFVVVAADGSGSGSTSQPVVAPDERLSDAADAATTLLIPARAVRIDVSNAQREAAARRAAEEAAHRQVEEARQRRADAARIANEAQQAESARVVAEAREAARAEEARRAIEAEALAQFRRAEEAWDAARMREAEAIRQAEQERESRAAREAAAEAEAQARRAEAARLAALALVAEKARRLEQERIALNLAKAAEALQAAEECRRVEEARRALQVLQAEKAAKAVKAEAAAKAVEADRARAVAEQARREQEAEAGRQAESMRLAEIARRLEAVRVEEESRIQKALQQQ